VASSASRSPPKRVRLASSSDSGVATAATAGKGKGKAVAEEYEMDEDDDDDDEDADERRRRSASSDSEDDVIMASARLKPQAVDEDDDEDDEAENELDEDEEDRLEDARLARAQADPLGAEKKAKQGVEGVMGIIQEVTLTDFMCHRKFNIKLGPFINFVCGGNGSGKSAILTGILVGLGQKAAATGRANGLKDFIRKPSDEERRELPPDRCEIQIKLKNAGENAWKPAEYGKSITVVRTITMSASSYKIKSAKGETVSTKAAELQALLEHMQVHIDNPISVLDQDMTKKFLTSTSNSQKYDVRGR